MSMASGFCPVMAAHCSGVVPASDRRAFLCEVTSARISDSESGYAVAAVEAEFPLGSEPVGLYLLEPPGDHGRVGTCLQGRVRISTFSQLNTG